MGNIFTIRHTRSVAECKNLEVNVGRIQDNFGVSTKSYIVNGKKVSEDFMIFKNFNGLTLYSTDLFMNAYSVKVQGMTCIFKLIFRIKYFRGII